MVFKYIKALHIIFVVTWFAGLFYIVRLFIYQTEAQDETNDIKKDAITQQLQLMSKRLWTIITWPSAILTLILASNLLFLQPSYLTMSWMHIKLLFVAFLYAYHFWTHRIYNHLQSGQYLYSAQKLRLINEAPTLLLFSIVFLVVLKHSFNWIFGVLGFFSLMIILMIGIKWYRKIRGSK